MLEIEIKVRVSTIEEIKKRIITIGGEHSETVVEEDQYYNAPHRDFEITDEALRVRSAGGGTILTYKGPKNTLLGSKIREECNVRIDDAETFDTILKNLGFRPVAHVRKLREYYAYQDFSIALDKVDQLGEFVEIELVTENDVEMAAKRVDELAEKLGVIGERISISYLELLLSKL
ncbi:MAG: class IV adenylate cyclase [Methanomicrobiales archaeon]|jgi:adenylate cyclase class 2|nr:class IV adenylate cyclase [Methanomicrobiales archaeon]